MYYKVVENKYLLALYNTATPIEVDGVVEIKQEEFASLTEISKRKPEDTDTVVYMLNAETLEYEAVPYKKPEEPESTYTLDEAAAIIASEVASNE